MDNAPHTLADVDLNVDVTVIDIDAKQNELNRLIELGLLDGTSVRVVRRAPTGDPIEIRFHQNTVSIRRSEARGIRVEFS